VYLPAMEAMASPPPPGVKSMRDTCWGPVQTLDHIENANFAGLLTRLGESLIPDTPVMKHVLTPTEGEQLWPRHV
jgi:hypothetical protein